MSMIAYMYYVKELKSLQMHCSMEMTNAALTIKSDIMKSYMDKDAYHFKPADENFRYAVLYANKNTFYSNLSTDKTLDLEKANSHIGKFNYHVLPIDDKNIDLGYIVVEDINGFNEEIRLKVIVISTFVVAFAFMAFIGYLLSKILMRPVKEKAAQLNRFVRDSSHELNTPIAALMMSLPKLQTQESKYEKVIHHVSASTKNIKQAYDRLLFNINHEVVQKHDEVFDLGALLEETCSFFDEIARSKSITLHCELESLFVNMDKYSAQMLLNNLLSNAIKYTKKHKNIYITLKKAHFSLEDEGIGIKDEDQRHIFTRYKRASNQEGGFGIGLDIVSSICKEYAIDLDFASTYGVGTRFELDFSRVENT